MSRSDFDHTPEKGFDARSGSMPVELFQKMENNFEASPDPINLKQLEQRM
jgi:hypothetical protein